MRLALDLGKLVKLIFIWIQRVVMYEAKGGGLATSEVLCDRSSIMAGEEPSSPSVRVFMTEEEALWHKFEHVDSQQGSCSEGNLLATVLTARALS